MKKTLLAVAYWLRVNKLALGAGVVVATAIEPSIGHLIDSVRSVAEILASGGGH